MAIGIIQIDLLKPKVGSYFVETQELIDEYLSGNHSLETVNALISELVEDEIMSFVEESFYIWGLNKTKYNVVSQDTFIELQQNEMLPPSLEYSVTMYGNFKYADKEFTHPEGNDGYLDSNLPCMVYFAGNIVTFFILDDEGDNGIT